MSQHCTSAAILRPFIEQALQRPYLSALPVTRQAVASFSTSSPHHARKDGNKRRGESALHGTFAKRHRMRGGRPTFFPQPVLDPAQRSKVQIDENHGLWGFFNQDRSPLLTPEDLDSHGRAWTVAELRKKDFEDLWKLYWQCVKEVNRIATYERERDRLKAGYGQGEAEDRINEVRKTQKAIKHTLTERWYKFETARELAMQDPEVNLYANVAEGELAYTQDESKFVEQDRPSASA